MTPDVSPGRVLGGRYQIGAPLGMGGWGVVHEATQLDLGRRVAVKVLREADAAGADLARFEREARAAAALGHPNIVQVFDFQNVPGEPPFLVMEHLTGRSLAVELRAQPTLPAARVVAVARQILAALEAAHRAGIVHRDVKPENVFLVRAPGVEDFVKLLDFGVAKLTSDKATQLTATGALVGSPSTMAPEQILGLAVDARTDVYAVGVTMYRALSGRMPFSAASLHELLVAIRDERPAPLGALVPGLDPRLEQIVARAMHKDPAGRFPSAEAMLSALEGLGTVGPSMVAAAGSAPVEAPPTIVQGAPTLPPPAPTPPPHQPPARSSGLVVGLLAAAAVLLALVVVGVGGAASVLARGAEDPEPATEPDAAVVAADAPAAAIPPASSPAPPTPPLVTSATAPAPPARPAAGPKAPRAEDAGARVDAGAPPRMSGATPRLTSIAAPGIRPDDVRAAVEPHMRAVTDCFVQNQLVPPEHEFVMYDLRVMANGSVTEVGPRRFASAPRCAPLDACMARALRGVKLPHAAKEPIIGLGFVSRIPQAP